MWQLHIHFDIFCYSKKKLFHDDYTNHFVNHKKLTYLLYILIYLDALLYRRNLFLKNIFRT